MATLTIRQLDEKTKSRLRVRAAQHGHSMEAEARDILRSTLSGPLPATGKSLVDAIRRRVAEFGGADLKLPPRGPVREPPDFGE